MCMLFFTTKRLLLFLQILLVVSFLGFSVSAVAQNQVEASIRQLASSPAMQGGSLSACVIDVQTGQMVASYDPDRRLVPASVQKVVTTATALDMLGADFTFETTLSYFGQIDASGTLNGNVYLRGSGDPTLGAPEWDRTLPMEALLQNWVQVIRAKGIKKINGSIVADPSTIAAAPVPDSWQWNDMGNYYGAGVWGLNMHENLYYLWFQQRSQLGATPKVVNISPSVPDLSIDNQVRSAPRGSGDNAYIFGAPYTDQRTIRGTIPVGSQRFKIKGSLPDPPLFAAQQLHNALEGAGVSISKSPRISKGGSADRRTTLVSHRSPELWQIVGRTNEKSVNLYAEALLLQIKAADESSATRASSLDQLMDHWAALGIDPDGAHLRDGSGLSARNTMSSRFLAALLEEVYHRQTTFDPLLKSLPLAGSKGILKNRLRGTAAEGRLYAKSGTLDQVRSYAGYAQRADGRWYAFAFLVNNYSGSGSQMRRQLEQLMLSLF
ncbi:MAG: D-alanyl-D-alanine carboxypeptidase/D-alanyl-D-alanine-endopeptidase [Bacteroidota bacterium]